VEVQSGPVGTYQFGSNPSTLYWKQYAPLKHEYPLEHYMMS